MTHHESAAKGPDGRMVDRMLFFSDAVFAIVLTIMVLELRPPHTEGSPDRNRALLEGLGEMIHEFAAFVISFLLVGGWWLIHMRATRKLKTFDWPTAIFNMLFLLAISLVPFASAVFGADINGATSMQVYWGVNAAASITMTMLFLVMARGKGRLIGGLEPGEWSFRVMQSIAPGIAFLCGVWLAGAGHLDYARFCWALILPIMMVARVVRAAQQPRAPRPA